MIGQHVTPAPWAEMELFSVGHKSHRSLKVMSSPIPWKGKCIPLCLVAKNPTVS